MRYKYSYDKVFFTLLIKGYVCTKFLKCSKDISRLALHEPAGT